MSTAIIIVLGIVIVIILLSPFFSKALKKEGAIVQENDQQDKEHIFLQLADLEYDFQMGKLSEKDFRKTKNELTARAARFVQTGNKLEQIQLMVDKEISVHLEKNGLDRDTEVGYEN